MKTDWQLRTVLQMHIPQSLSAFVHAGKVTALSAMQEPTLPGTPLESSAAGGGNAKAGKAMAALSAPFALPPRPAAAADVGRAWKPTEKAAAIDHSLPMEEQFESLTAHLASLDTVPGQLYRPTVRPTVPANCTANCTVTVRSPHSHRTVTTRLLYSLHTVSIQSPYSHRTVTVQSTYSHAVTIQSPYGRCTVSSTVNHTVA